MPPYSCVALVKYVVKSFIHNQYRNKEVYSVCKRTTTCLIPKPLSSPDTLHISGEFPSVQGADSGPVQWSCSESGV